MECDYGEMEQASGETRQKARKEHKCCECGNKIHAGNYYFRISILFDGEWSHYKQCENCNEIFDIATQAGVCPYVDNLFNCIKEVWFDIEEKYRKFFIKRMSDFLPDYFLEDTP